MTTTRDRLTACVLCLAIATLTTGLVLSAVGGAASGQSAPTIGARVRAALDIGGLTFKDSNGNGRLDPYEDWRPQTTTSARRR